jgi:hypothetical protein
MNTDAFFCIGKTHAICQDYAEAGEGHVILSDGCSTAEESNIGAILLSRAAKMFLRKFPYHDIDIFCQSALAIAYTYAKALELPEQALYATLGTAKCEEDNIKFQVMLYGDGVMAARRRKTNIWDVSVFEFASGAPYYLAYELSPHWEEIYLQKFGTESKRTTYELMIEDGGFKVSQKGCYTNKDVTAGSLGPVYMNYPYEKYDMVAILSDGAASFQKTSTTLTSKRQESVPVCNVLSEVLHFKNYNGQFVQRRCKAAFRKFSEDNCVNMDDFSLGVLYRPEEA